MAETTCNTLLMVRPASFGFNSQTAESNSFSSKTDLTPSQIQNKAIEEFDLYVELLRSNNIKVIVIEDTKIPEKPDAIFPNNWISFHGKTAVVYPMVAVNRRLERREDIFEELDKHGVFIDNVIDYTSAEEEGVFLEGTGSIVLDRENRVAYCGLSPRSDEELFIEFCEDLEYTPIIFNTSYKGKPVYHTNVMMAITSKIVFLCLELIPDKKQRKLVKGRLKQSGRSIISLSISQIENFAANIYDVVNAEGAKILVMSSAALKSFQKNQLEEIRQHHDILSPSIPTIESVSGGSVRCMVGRIFLE